MIATALTKKGVLDVARLAKLPLSTEELTSHQKDLSKVIDHFDELKEINTDKVEPTSQTSGLTNVTRPDSLEISECLSSKEALSGTDKVENDYFLVPFILKK